ncbi:xanthine dehydrogenase family protein molybdopterin-binding subunit [Desertibaculum subflavum]|uniref:xanthine dehydrogenase family protein molybdopterin-binding subunit n=1 Tax=Desertibaculum subflavum TaxID=2268458 RepID=UPI000E66020B
MKRRTFLLGAAAIGTGGLVLGYRAWSDRFEAQAAQLTAGDGGKLIAGWVRIGSDDSVTVYVPHIDMGQGTATALAMMLAEELDADWSKVRPERAPGEKAFANRFLAEGWILQGLKVPRFLDGAVDVGFAEAARFVNLQITGGSTAVRFTGQVGMRIVGAAARSMLVEAAAKRWGVSAAELATADSVVTHAKSGRAARYGELAAAAAELSVPSSPPLKARETYRIIGTSPARFDIPAKVKGAPLYAIDLRLPEMRYAAVMSAPVHGGALQSLDPAPAQAVKGVEQVVKFPHGIGVIARNWWQAQKGLAALKPVFSDGGNGNVSSASLAATQESALGAADGKSMVKLGDAEAALQQPGARIVEATYHVPFLHHAAMEPINATAQVKDGRLTVWGGEQDALGAKMKLVQLSGFAADKVTLHPLPVGGSFGRRVTVTTRHLEQVVELAKAASPNPVQMIWSREEDFAQGTYRPQVASRIRAALGPDGKPTAWSQSFVETPGINEAIGLPYPIPNQSIRAVPVPVHVTQGSWRSVAHTQHGFYTETFIDELAQAAGRDPFEYRRDLLPAGSRQRRVLEIAAEKAGWGKPLPEGRGLGIALVESFGTVVAQVIEASQGRNGVPVVQRVVAAVDCGDVCHPDTATQQVEGAIVMGLGAAIAERITIENGAVRQRNFPDYPISTMASTPPVIEVHFVPSDGAWGGLGEPGMPPVAPALANALFAATGRRARSLPLKLAAAA